jgi:hypothetical protein
LVVYPTGDEVDTSGKNGDGFLSVYLEVPADDAASLPSGWNQQAEFSLTLVSHTDENCNVEGTGRSLRTFKAGNSNWGNLRLVKLTALNDTSKGFIVNDTLIIKCDMSNMSPAAAPAAPQRIPASWTPIPPPSPSSQLLTLACPSPPPPPPSSLPPTPALSPAPRPASPTPPACTPPAPAASLRAPRR